ncbi:hypothetical protein AGMMS49959_04100 [Planctomycetales bacterium]|nr:hypothetical protein AGMMS49959_04100 [Planctomycetales bacterium]
MLLEIRLPQMAKRMTGAVFAQWLVTPGDVIRKGQPICDVTIDKVTLEIDSEIDGVVAHQIAAAGQLVPVHGILALATATADEKISREQLLAYPGFAPAPPLQADCAITPDLGDYLVPSNAMRTIIAQRMTVARTDIPHFYVTTSVDMTNAMQLRQRLKKEARQRIAYNEMLIKASGVALRRYPEVASLYTTQGFVRRNHMNVGFAVAIEPDGLVVPVVAEVDKKSLKEVSDTVKELARRARNKRLTPDEYGFGVFTVSNLSSYDVDQFTAIINPVNAAILAVGKVAETPVVKHHEICIRPLMKITLSSDHRVIDGVLAAKFNAYIKYLLENPETLIEPSDDRTAPPPATEEEA